MCKQERKKIHETKNSEQETEVGFDAEAVAIELASELRWSQHQVLLACAIGLRDYVAREA